MALRPKFHHRSCCPYYTQKFIAGLIASILILHHQSCCQCMYPYKIAGLVAHAPKCKRRLCCPRPVKTQLVLFLGIFHIQFLSEVGNINIGGHSWQMYMFTHDNLLIFQHRGLQQKYARTSRQIMIIKVKHHSLMQRTSCYRIQFLGAKD